MISNSYTLKSNEECTIILKKFKAPITKYYQTQLQMDKDGKLAYDIKANLEFYLRFYFPKSQLTTPHARPSQLIIMFNSLNEIYSRHFSLYDRLGNTFASRGITTVLLPTPFHLNRTPIRKASLDKYSNRTSVPETTEHYKIPSMELVKNPFYLYMGFIQILHEYRILRHLLVGEFEQVVTSDDYTIDPPTNEDKFFYEQYVISQRSNIEVSILGYAFGGLMALLCFYDNPDIIKSCILLNAGAPLDKMNLRSILDEDVWENMLRKLRNLEEPEDKRLLHMHIYRDPNFDAVRSVFFSDNLFSPDNIERIGRKLILIIGGNDKIIPPDSIKRLEPEGYGLNIFQISKLGHFLSDDVAFNRWYPRLINLVTDFIQEPYDQALSKREALYILLEYDGLCDGELFMLDNDEYPDRSTFTDFKEKINIKLKNYCNESTMKRLLLMFEEIYKITFAYVASPHHLHNQLKSIKRKKGLCFGDILISQYPWLSKNEMIMGKLDKLNETNTGEILIENNVIDKQTLDHVLRQQLVNYRNLFEETPYSKNVLDPVFEKRLLVKNVI